MTFKEFYEDLTPYEQQLYLINSKLRKQLDDSKITMFWYLQLQFMALDTTEISLLNLLDRSKSYYKLNDLRYNGEWEDYKMELATELALQLSGVE